ncbi:asparaginase [Alicyclobacillaceae bacterium I2511]|nr:asparaginase [Alicyclobacillaceae bacterium I2511]
MTSLVEVTRGNVVESVHHGSVAVVSTTGQQIAHVGNTDLVTFARSSAKPVQAIPVVESGALTAFALEEADLALFCASHSSELQHTDRVTRILEMIGLDESYLQCGGHIPHSMETYDRLVVAGSHPTSLYSNCSGKHTGMLTYCKHTAADVHTYHNPEHPLQRRILSILAELSEIQEEDIQLATDGCGVPTFALPLHNWALVIAKFTNSGVGTHTLAMNQISAAMRHYPELVAGTGRFDTQLMRITDGRVLIKSGAEGFALVADTEQRLGLAIKVRDGAGRAVPPVVMETLRQLHLLQDEELAELKNFWQPPVFNTREEHVGDIFPRFKLIRDSVLS